MEEYLTVQEVADRLKLSPKSIRNKMASGIFREGLHYFRPKSMTPRFKWSALVAWLEAQKEAAPDNDQDKVPMARGYVLGQSREKRKIAVGG